jgi:hypothetical protein
MNLLDLVDNSRTDKNTTNSFLDLYQKLFINKRETSQNILEIGIGQGGSIKLWYDFFPNATIYGLDIIIIKDIWSEVKNKDRIKLGRFNAYNNYFVTSQFLNKNIKFDIMLDDGPHTLESMIQFIRLYTQLMTDDGILIIESVQSLDWVEILKNEVPENLKQFIKVYDLREIKNRYDDIVFTIDKTQVNTLEEIEEPVVETQPEPVVEEPVVETQPEPVVEEPIGETQPEPVVEESVVEEPVVETQPEPVVEESVVEEPVVEEPVVEIQPEPVVEEPVVEEPVVEEPVVEIQPEPVVEEPVVEIQPEPVVEESVVETQPEPVVEEPVVETQPEPVVETQPEPVVETQPEPVVETQPEPVVEEPVVETQPEPVVEESVVETQPEPVVE